MNKQELAPTAPGQAEVVNHLRELYPREHPDALGWILWNYTCFPFPEGSDPLAHWIQQVDEYLQRQEPARG